VLVPDERPENQPSVVSTKRDTQARAAAARASSREVYAKIIWVGHRLVLTIANRALKILDQPTGPDLG